jgi:hypothetical protein
MRYDSPTLAASTNIVSVADTDIPASVSVAVS